MSYVETTLQVPEWTLCDRLAKARHVSGLSQGELAKRLGLSLKSVARYEQGTHSPKRSTVLAWALVCGIDPAWLESGTVTDSEPVSPGMSFTGRYMAA